MKKNNSRNALGYVRIALIVLCAGVMIFAGIKLSGIIAEYNAASSTYDDISESAVTALPEAIVSQADAVPQVVPPFAVDFDALHEINEDVVGWIYCEGTPINYPIAQGEDNEEYLHTLIDGLWNFAGTIFADARCASDFGDPHTVLYGHNMGDGSMFAAIKKYHQQEFYDEHPVMWLFTPEETYVIDLIAGFVTKATSESYILHDDTAAMREYLASAVRKSNFAAGVDINTVEHLITLSTCSYEYDTARYVLHGSLVPVSAINAGEVPMPSGLLLAQETSSTDAQ